MRYLALVPSLRGSEQEVAKPRLTQVLFQVYMFKCVWRCYKFMRYTNSAAEKGNSKMLPKVRLTGSSPSSHSLAGPLGPGPFFLWALVSPFVR